MPRPATFPPKLHAHRGRARTKWQGKWWDCGKEGTPDAERKYRRLLALWAEDPTAGLPADEYLVAQLCRDYLVAAPFAAGEKGQTKRALSLLLDLYADTTVDEFGPLALGAWLRSLADRKRADGSPLYTRGYLGKFLRHVVAAFRWGVGHETVDPAKLEGLRAVTVRRMGRASRVVTAVSDADLEAALPFLSHAARGLVRVLRATGARPSEVFGLRPCDLDRSGDVWVYRPAKHKTADRGKDRPVFFGPRARAVLAEYEPADPELPYFVGRRGAVYNRNSLVQALARACKRAGVPRWYPYQLRHARLTEVRAAVGIEGAAAIGGHARLNTTEIYSLARFDLAAKVAAESG